MVYDIEMLRSFYSNFPKRVDVAREKIGRPMTLAEKILYAHLYDEKALRLFRRGDDYVNFRPDRVAMQDATAQMALLQFMNAGKKKSAVPATVHCDHLIQANIGAKADIETATKGNSEVYDFLKSVSDKFGIGFWKPGGVGKLCLPRRNDGRNRLAHAECRRTGNGSHRCRWCRCRRCNDRDGMGTEDAETDRCQAVNVHSR